MNILFLSLLDFESINEHSIYTDLLREFHKNRHSVYAISPVERKKKKETHLISGDRVKILKLQIGNMQKTNILEKGISTFTIESIVIKGIKKYFSDVKFDLVLYTTPPITLQKAVNYVKKRDNAITYLMLKDIFPQNAVDMGMLSKSGLKGMIYKYFRNKEKKLYRDSDYIGCMSQANVDYVKKNNPQIQTDRIEICPNCIEPTNRIISEEEKGKIREKLGIPNDKIVFVYGGNLGKPQGVPFLIECLRKVKENEQVFFLIVGNGTEYSKLEKFIIEEKPENVKLMQALPKVEYENMILAADVGMIFLDFRFTIPNFPSRILSYMDAAIPVLSVTDSNTDVGQVIVEAEMGDWCVADDEQKFSQKIMEFCENRERRQMGLNAKEYLKAHYTVEHSYNIIIRHFDKG